MAEKVQPTLVGPEVYAGHDPSDPISQVASGNLSGSRSGVEIYFTSFESARLNTRRLPGAFVDKLIQSEMEGDDLPFNVGTERVGLKGFADCVEPTDKDRAVMGSPEAIADLYESTTDMIARNLKIRVAKGTSPERRQEVSGAKNNFLADISAKTAQTREQIIDWVSKSGEDHRTYRRPRNFEYFGFEVSDGDKVADPIGWGDKGAKDLHPNIKIQRQAGGNFIFGYSDARVEQRMEGERDQLTHRIYLNPDMVATPEIFEKILNAANATGMPLEVKMLQRSEELGRAYIEKSRDPNRGEALRGDGIVMYVSDEASDDALEMALAIAKDHPEAFIGRKTSRLPQAVAEGIAIGDEPIQKPGQDPESLTSHRMGILGLVAYKVGQTGKTGIEAREAFQRGLEYYAKREGINPLNLAFNA